MMVLNDQQRQELAAAEPQALDPLTKETYVLVRKHVYEKLRALLSDDSPSMGEVAQLVERAMSDDDANDPTLAYYQEKYGRKA